MFCIKICLSEPVRAEIFWMEPEPRSRGPKKKSGPGAATLLSSIYTQFLISCTCRRVRAAGPGDGGAGGDAPPPPGAGARPEAQARGCCRLAKGVFRHTKNIFFKSLAAHFCFVFVQEDVPFSALRCIEY